ncbi:UNVERIFIED_CONTAM: hypothetical protein GTU68_003266 [Idotea baltica]|nr:hypothetical protein [Idotea baltica]
MPAGERPVMPGRLPV